MTALSNPLGWTLQTRLLISAVLLAAAVVVALIQAVKCAPTLCDECQRLVSPGDVEEHAARHQIDRLAHK